MTCSIAGRVGVVVVVVIHNNGRANFQSLLSHQGFWCSSTRDIVQVTRVWFSRWRRHRILKCAQTKAPSFRWNGQDIWLEEIFSYELSNLADEIQVVQGFDYFHSLTGPRLYVTKGQARLLPAERELPKILQELNA